MKKVFLILSLLIIMSCKHDTTPKLVVLISVDHLSYKAFEHYSDLYTGGFKWLRDHGVQFSNTFHEHGYTATGPGHFVLGSGRYPGLAGVLGNSWYDRKTEKSRYCVEDNDAKPIGIPSDARSYRLINATTTGDWLKAVNPKSKVYSIAGKDRASIFMGGKNADMSLWYNWDGAFTTTDYYTKTIPQWLIDYNDKLHLMTYRDSLWTRSLTNDKYLEYARIDHFVGEADNYLSYEYSPVFPIGFDSTITDSMILDYFGGFPWQERNTLGLAETIIREEKLGKDNIPDLISIGLSATDWITHDYGPRSQEGMDNLIKIDRYIGHFLDVVDEEVGLNNTIIILTADHGGLELPEFIKVTTGEYTGRIDGTLRDEAIEKAYSNIDSLVGNHDFIIRYGLGFYFDHSKIKEQNIIVDEIVKVIKSEVEKVEGIALVLTKDEILNASPDNTLLMRMKHFTHPELSPDLWTIQEKNWVYRNPYGTSHGTPYDYDAHVPFVISHPKFKSKTISDKISTVDIAPTIADILGVSPGKHVDGHSRKSKIR